MAFYQIEDYSPERSVGYLVKRVFALSHVALEPVFAAADLSGIQFSALAFISMGHGETCAELARELGYDKGAMTRTIDVLEGRGLVERRRCGQDRRVVRLVLSEEGKRLADEMRAVVIGRWNAWLEGWEAAEVETLIAGLQRLRADIERVG